MMTRCDLWNRRINWAGWRPTDPSSHPFTRPGIGYGIRSDECHSAGHGLTRRAAEDGSACGSGDSGEQANGQCSKQCKKGDAHPRPCGQLRLLLLLHLAFECARLGEELVCRPEGSVCGPEARPPRAVVLLRCPRLLFSLEGFILHTAQATVQGLALRLNSLRRDAHRPQ